MNNFHLSSSSKSIVYDFISSTIFFTKGQHALQCGLTYKCATSKKIVNFLKKKENFRNPYLKGPNLGIKTLKLKYLYQKIFFSHTQSSRQSYYIVMISNEDSY